MVIESDGNKYEISMCSVRGRRDSDQDYGGWVLCDGGRAKGNIMGKEFEKEYPPEKTLFFAMVYDGMGGMKNGGAASKMIAEKMIGWAVEANGKNRNILRSMSDAMETEERILMSVQSGSGTAVSVLLAYDGKWISSHLGDSRCYAAYPDGMFRTLDHSPVEEMYKNVRISLEEMNGHPMKNIISRYVGGGGFAELKTTIVLKNGWNAVLLCSDGAYGAEKPDGFECLVRSDLDSDGIIKKCFEDGSDDNITAIKIKAAENSSATL